MSAQKQAPKPSPTRIVEAEFSAGAQVLSSVPAPLGIEIAFAGRSNVGKSSLMNAVMGRRNLVRTSSTPGCTRQISFYSVRCADGAQLTLVDLPGYGYAKRSKSERRAWADLIEGYLLGRPTLSVVASLVDVRRGFEADDLELLELLASPPTVERHTLQVVPVATKVDKLKASERKLALKKLEAPVKRRVVPFSTQLPDTTIKVWNSLRRAAGLTPEPAPAERSDAAQP